MNTQQQTGTQAGEAGAAGRAGPAGANFSPRAQGSLNKKLLRKL